MAALCSVKGSNIALVRVLDNKYVKFLLELFVFNGIHGGVYLTHLTILYVISGFEDFN